jgi:hypothetical protein
VYQGLRAGRARAVLSGGGTTRDCRFGKHRRTHRFAVYLDELGRVLSETGAAGRRFLCSIGKTPIFPPTTGRCLSCGAVPALITPRAKAGGFEGRQNLLLSGRIRDVQE